MTSRWLRRTLLVIPAFLLVLSTPTIQQVTAKDEWTTVQSRNFTLVGNAGEREIRRVAMQLEQFRAAFGRLFSQARLQSSAPTRVIVFKSDGSFRAFKPVHEGRPAAVTGYFQPASDVNYIALTVETREERPYGTIFHEYVHALTRNNTRNAPLWFSEGLAEYYSTFEALDGGKKLLLGKPIASHVHYLRDHQAIPLQTLFAVNHGSAYYNEREKKGAFYAQSWALLHFFMQGNEGQHRPAFNKYLSLLATGTPIEESFRQAFNTDFATLERDLTNYISRNRYSFDAFTLGDRLNVDTEMAAKPLSEADSQYYLGDLLLHTQRLDEAEAHLQHAIALDGKHAAARASLGMLRVRQRRFSEARENLAAAAASETGVANPLVHYYYASAISGEYISSDNTMTQPTPEAIRLMRTELRKTIELAPEFAEAYRLLAFVELLAGEDMKEAERVNRRALALSPGEGEYGYLLAQILLRDVRFDEARSVLMPLATGASEEGLRLRAEALLERVEAEIARRVKEVENRRAAQAAAAATGSQPEAYLPSLGPTLRRRADGEEQVEGLMMSIECTRNAMTLTVKVEQKLVRLWAPSVDAVRFVSFTPGVKLICGLQKVPGRVRVTYRPVPAGKGKERGVGEPLVVEFLKPQS